MMTLAIIGAAGRVASVALPGHALVVVAAIIALIGFAVRALPDDSRRGPQLASTASLLVIGMVIAGNTLRAAIAPIDAALPMWRADLTDVQREARRRPGHRAVAARGRGRPAHHRRCAGRAAGGPPRAGGRWRGPDRARRTGFLRPRLGRRTVAAGGRRDRHRRGRLVGPHQPRRCGARRRCRPGRAGRRRRLDRPPGPDRRGAVRDRRQRCADRRGRTRCHDPRQRRRRGGRRVGGRRCGVRLPRRRGQLRRRDRAGQRGRPCRSWPPRFLAVCATLSFAALNQVAERTSVRPADGGHRAGRDDRRGRRVRRTAVHGRRQAGRRVDAGRRRPAVPRTVDRPWPAGRPDARRRRLRLGGRDHRADRCPGPNRGHPRARR